MTRRIILLNGPPRSGKDTAGNHIMDRFGATRASFADELKTRTHGLYGIRGVSPLHFEDVKDQPLPEFLGLTPRQAYINTSELLLKQAHGKDVMGRLLLQNALVCPGLYVAPDSGFVEEAHPIIEALGHENALLIRVHATKRGCTFTGDSRNFIGLARVKTYDVHNDDFGDEAVARFKANVEDIVRHWLDGFRVNSAA